MSNLEGGEKKKSSIITFLRMIFLRTQTFSLQVRMYVDESCSNVRTTLLSVIGNSKFRNQHFIHCTIIYLTQIKPNNNRCGCY